MKIRPEGEQFIHADRGTDRYDETKSRFSRIRERNQKDRALFATSIFMSSFTPPHVLPLTDAIITKKNNMFVQNKDSSQSHFSYLVS